MAMTIAGAGVTNANMVEVAEEVTTTTIKTKATMTTIVAVDANKSTEAAVRTSIPDDRAVVEMMDTVVGAVAMVTNLQDTKVDETMMTDMAAVDNLVADMVRTV